MPKEKTIIGFCLRYIFDKNEQPHMSEEIICASGVTGSTSAFQAEGRGSSPTLALHFYRFEPCQGADIVKFIIQHHYTHSMSGVQYRFAFCAKLNEVTVGAAVFGQTAMPTTWKKYARCQRELTELRRLVFIDETPKNIESKFIGYCLRWLRKNTSLRYVLSYADPYFNHSGTIYRASNFKYLGTTAKCRMVEWKGKLRHSKSLQAGRKTEIRPYSYRIRDALKCGEAKYISRPGKHIFLYTL